MRDAGPIADLARRPFRVEYTLTGGEVLLHRIGWSVQVPARRAAERDEAAVAAWRQETWPVIKDGGGAGREAGLRVRVRTGLKVAEGPHLGAPRQDSVLAVTGGRNTRLSLAALIAVKLGRGPGWFTASTAGPGAATSARGSHRRTRPGCWTPRTSSSAGRSSLYGTT